MPDERVNWPEVYRKLGDYLSRFYALPETNCELRTTKEWIDRLMRYVALQLQLPEPSYYVPIEKVGGKINGIVNMGGKAKPVKPNITFGAKSLDEIVGPGHMKSYDSDDFWQNYFKYHL